MNKDNQTNNKKTKKEPAYVLRVVMLTIGILLLTAMIWAKAEIKGISLSVMVFNLLVPMGGVDWGIVMSYILKGLLPAIGLSLLIIGIIVLFKKHPALKAKEPWFKKIILYIAFALLIFDGIKFWVDFKVFNFIKSQVVVSTFFEDNYVSPRDVEIKFPEKKRNLVYIYLESMETTFVNEEIGGAIKENIIPGLVNYAQDDSNISFSNTGEGMLGGAYQSAFSAWTIASFFGQTTGLPFKIPMRNNDMDNYDFFMPGAVSLGEILAENGYRNYLVQGSKAEFGGTKNFVDSHGEYVIYDYDYAIDTGRIDKDYKVFWGIEDEKLFDMAKEKLAEIAKKDEPFNFSVFTIDSHYPNGYKCRLCRDEYDTEYENAIACSARQTVEFVEWIKTQPFYENTTIILTGDHLSMSKVYGKLEETGYERRIYNVFINTPAVPHGEVYNRDFNIMDMFPTTLAALGATVEGDRLGLGTNLFSTKKTLAEEYGIEKFEDELAKKSKYFDRHIMR